MSYHKTLAWPEYFIKASPSSDSFSVPGFIYSELGGWCFSSQCPREGQSGLTQSTFWLSALGQYLSSFCIWIQWVCFYVCCPLSAQSFFLSVQRMHLTPKILELRSGMLRRQAPSLSLRGNSSWWNPSYLAFQPRACRHLHLSCIPHAPQTLESREENRHFWGAIHLSLM